MTVERWHAKADAFAAGWRAKFSVAPLTHAVVLGLAQAELETRCGDSWPGEYNWGAVQIRVPNAAEQAVLASLAPQPSTVEAARAAIDAAITAGVIPPPDRCALHVDSTPTATGPRWYWCWFFRGADDAEGAAVFVHQIAEVRPSCRAILENPLSTAHDEAARLYTTHYYEGRHKPKRADGSIDEAAIAANVADYTAAMLRFLPDIAAALANWTPASPSPDPVAVATAVRLSQLVARLAAGGPVGLDAIDAIAPRT